MQTTLLREEEPQGTGFRLLRGDLQGPLSQGVALEEGPQTGS